MYTFYTYIILRKQRYGYYLRRKMHFLSCLPHLNAKQASFFQFSASSILAEDRVGAQVNLKPDNSNLSKTFNSLFIFYHISPRPLLRFCLTQIHCNGNFLWQIQAFESSSKVGKRTFWAQSIFAFIFLCFSRKIYVANNLLVNGSFT